MKISLLISLCLGFSVLFLLGCKGKKGKYQKVEQLQPLEEAPTPGEYKIMPRSDWTDEGPDETRIVAMTNIHRITIHHTAMPDDNLPDLGGDSKVRLQKILQWHKHHNNWADIGYHYVIDVEGVVWEGRNIKFQGAHAGKDEYNIGNIGVVLVGNFENYDLTEKQKVALIEFVHFLKAKYNIKSENIFAHEHFTGTKCPGKFAVPLVEKIRSETEEEKPVQ